MNKESFVNARPDAPGNGHTEVSDIRNAAVLRDGSAGYPVRKNIRLTHYDYSSPGEYFVTICTKDRKFLFGDIKNGKMRYTQIGKIVCDEIIDLPCHYKNVSVDSFVVMPNHVHMIITISKEACCANPLKLGNIVGLFKSGVSRKAGTPVWQRGYYDHIIRDGEDLFNIRCYIENNPLKWENDMFFKKKQAEMNNYDRSDKNGRSG